MPFRTGFTNTVVLAAAGALAITGLSACGSPPKQTTSYGVEIASTQNVNGDVIATDVYDNQTLLSMVKSDLDEDLLSRDMTFDEIQTEHYNLGRDAKTHKDAVLLHYKTACMVANSSTLRPDFEHPHRELVSGADQQDTPAMAFFGIVTHVSDNPPWGDVNKTNGNPAFWFTETRAEQAVVDAANEAHDSDTDTDFTWKCQLVRDINNVTDVTP